MSTDESTDAAKLGRLAEAVILFHGPSRQGSVERWKQVTGSGERTVAALVAFAKRLVGDRT